MDLCDEDAWNDAMSRAGFLPPILLRPGWTQYAREDIDELARQHRYDRENEDVELGSQF
jgi:hypothetical protein